MKKENEEKEEILNEEKVEETAAATEAKAV